MKERKKGLREERNAAEHEIWLLLERFTKHVALFLFLLFASSSLKFVVIRMSSSSMVSFLVSSSSSSFHTLSLSLSGSLLCCFPSAIRAVCRFFSFSVHSSLQL